MNNEVHTFVVEDQDHPQMIEIHAELQRLSGLMYDSGYVPCTESVLDDVEEEEKVFPLCHHSKKLAIAFGQHSSWYSSSNKKKSAGLQRLPHFHKVHFKNSWKIHRSERCQSLSSLRRWCLFLHGLLGLSALYCKLLQSRNCCCSCLPEYVAVLVYMLFQFFVLLLNSCS